MKNTKIKRTGTLKKISSITAIALLATSLSLPVYANNGADTTPIDTPLEIADVQGSNTYSEIADVPSGVDHPDPSIIEKFELLSSLGILKGDPDGNFRPYDGISRAESAAVFSRLLGASELPVTNDTGFEDVDSTCFASGYIKFLKDKELVRGNELGQYDPYTTISYGEFIKTLITVLENSYDDGAFTEYIYPYGYIVKAQKYGLLDEIEIDNPDYAIKRSEVALILVPALDVPLSKCIDKEEAIYEVYDGIQNSKKETFRINLSNKPLNPLNTSEPLQTALPITGVNRFAMNMNKEISSSQNYMFSPLSVKMAMAMTANGADGETKEEILSVLGIENLDEYNKSAQEMIEKYNANFDYDGYRELLKKTEDGTATTEDYEKFSQYQNQINRGDTTVMNIANSIWLNTDKASANQKFRTDFENTIKNDYHGSVSTVNNNNAVTSINTWTSDKTNGKIPEIIDSSDFLAALINAVYFKAAWADEFDKSATKPDTFHNYDGENKTVDFMNQTDNYGYYKDDNVNMVRIPYISNKAAMYISVDDGNIDNYDYYINKLENTYLDISMPKFKIEYSNDIGSSDKDSILNKLGIKTAFNSNLADLSKMIEGSGSNNPYIDKVIHKTYIDVDEKGTEAAAVTAVIIDCAGIVENPEPIKFKADTPFTFIIRDELSGEILFMGRLANM